MGKVTVVGGKVGMEAPITGVLASELAVGSSVYLIENGNPVEYLVVNLGIPSGSSLYDSSCNGTWLLRKDIKEVTNMYSSNNGTANTYKNSKAHVTWLNVDYFNAFDAVTQSLIKQVKIPCRSDNGNSNVVSGSSGLSTKLFLLSDFEVGSTGSKVDGACLSYFEGTSETDAKRIAYLNGSKKSWWLRSAATGTTDAYSYVTTTGARASQTSSNTHGIRPALVLQSNALFDAKTMRPKGVA